MASRLRVGLTGGIASGKSTAANRFLELGVPVIDADESARRVVAPGTAGLAEVLNKFGGHLLTSKGELDRRALRNVVFSDPARRRDLELILHPLIRTDMDRLAHELPGPYLLLAIPLLIEGGAFDLVDRILVVDVPEETQRKRLIERDGETPQQALAILAAQTSREKRLAAADDVLLNSGTMVELQDEVGKLHERYLRLAAAKPS